MVRAIAYSTLIASASAFTSFNSPSTPGNWNLPTDAGFGADVGAKSIPEINVRYNFPVTDASTLLAAAEGEENLEARLAAIRHDKMAYQSFMKRGAADLDAANSKVAITSASDDDGADAMMLGLEHSPRPHKSFMQAYDPMEIIPPGVTSGIAAKIADETPYTLVLHAPEESTAATNNLVDSYAKIEIGHERAIEQAALVEKQRLLSAEIAKVHELVSASRRAGFLKTIYSGSVRKPDYEVVLHAPSESTADINAAVNSILKVESSKAQSAAAQDQALKAALLSAEIAKIGRIVRGA